MHDNRLKKLFRGQENTLVTYKSWVSFLFLVTAPVASKRKFHACSLSSRLVSKQLLMLTLVNCMLTQELAWRSFPQQKAWGFPIGCWIIAENRFMTLACLLLTTSTCTTFNVQLGYWVGILCNQRLHLKTDQWVGEPRCLVWWRLMSHLATAVFSDT